MGQCYLGIETSCDETAVAVYDTARGILAHKIYTQIELHRQYGGVVPELAARDHVRKILPLIDALLTEAQITSKDIAGVAYTKGPGLIGALLIGATVGRTLAWAWQVPALGVHHMEGHLMAVMLEEETPSFPFLALLVSGGHSQIVKVSGLGQYEILGESLDDAAGEAFDKVAKLLDLDYPGGPAVAALAERGNPKRFVGKEKFPCPMTDRPGLDLSFSGLKTNTRNRYNQFKDEPNIKADIAYAFQEAVVDTLSIKCKRALEQEGLSELVIVGGVGANKRLRQQLGELMASRQGKVYYPRPEFCTDNGAMIAYLGSLRMERGEKDENLSINGKPRWDMETL